MFDFPFPILLSPTTLKKNRKGLDQLTLELMTDLTFYTVTLDI